MLFTTSILLIPGEKYDTLTTSDSGWFYDITVDISETNGMVENNPLSHAPYGHSVSLSDQGQPLLTAMLYKAVHAVNPDVTPMDVVRYWSPLLFALTLIPIFLIGKELGGDLAGCTAAFFASVLTGSIYWMKAGAFDREATQLILIAWTIYLTIKMSKARGLQTLRFGILSGLVLAIFALTWTGYEILIPVLIGWAAIVALSERLTYLPLMLGVGIVIGMYTAKLSYLLYAIVGALVLAVIMEVIFHKMSAKDLLYGIFKGIRSHLALLGGIATVFVAMTIAGTFIGVVSPYLWVNLPQTLLAYIGIGGGGGISFGRYAGEMAAPSSWSSVVDGFYAEKILTALVLVFMALALIKICWPRKQGETLKRWGLLMLPWLVILAGLVWPGSGQARFDRMWWPFMAVAAGIGVTVVVSSVKRLSWEPMTADWVKPFQKPVVIALCFSLAATPFIINAHTYAQGVTPPTEWHGYGLDEGLMDTFAWLRENTPENSVVAIEWSFGHLLTGTARRATVCDGGQTLGEIGKWENTEPSPPPDYIYTVSDSTGTFLNSSWTINGRRTDIQYLPTLTDDNELAFYLKTYRDNYGVRIDYVIFHQYQYSEAIWATRRGGVQTVTTSASTQGEQILFTFSDENVLFDPLWWGAYVERDEENLYLAGVVMVSFNQSGYLGRILNYNLIPDPEIPRVLWILMPDWVAAPTWDQTYAQLTAPTVYGLPILMRVFEGRGTTPDFMEVAYTSSNGLVKVMQINHENLP